MTTETQNNVDKDDIPLSGWFFLLIFVYMIGLFGFIFWFFTQTLTWLEAWLFTIAFAMNMTISYYVINKKNPRVIRNRMKIKKVGITEKTKKSAGSDRFILPLTGIGFFCTFVLLIFDYNTQWTNIPFDYNNQGTYIPFMVEILAFVISNIGLAIMNLAQLQNAYASKLLDINKDQKLIDTGLYAHIRHPLYSGAIIWVLFLPISLGSWISLIPAILAIIPLLIRIKFEEDMLINGMEGYEDYKTRVKYKLIPKIY